MRCRELKQIAGLGLRTESTTMKPTNAKGIARLFLRSLYAELGETDRPMKPAEYSALATKIGLTNSEMQIAIRRLKQELLIRFYPESTEIIRLTQFTKRGHRFDGSVAALRLRRMLIQSILPPNLTGQGSAPLWRRCAPSFPFPARSASGLCASASRTWRGDRFPRCPIRSLPIFAVPGEVELDRWFPG
jgi:hypothetical protein